MELTTNGDGREMFGRVVSMQQTPAIYNKQPRNINS